MAILALCVGVLCGIGLVLAWRPLWQWWQRRVLRERIVTSAVWTASAHRSVPQAKMVEAAMSQAVIDCLNSGISIEDSETIRATMLSARARVLGR